MTRGTAVLVTLVVYKLILLGLGVWGSRRTKNATDFYLGGRQLGPLVAAVSAAASSSSAWTILGVSGAAYSFGLSALWLFPACVGGFALNWYVLAPGLRRVSRERHAVTVIELLAGPRSRPLSGALRGVAATIVLVSLGCYVCSQFQAAGKTFAATFDMDPRWAVLMGATIVVAYTLLGGFWAASLTDTLQGLLMAGTAVLLPVGALLEVGGWSALSDGLAAVDQPGFLSLTRELPLMSGIGLVLGMLGVGLGYPGQPHVVNRLMALQDGEKPLRDARRIAMAWAALVFAGMLLLGLCGRVLYPLLADNETVFITATNGLFPPVVAGIMLAAVLSAIMSTADSQLLVAGSTVTHDLGLAGGSQASLLRRSRGVLLMLSAGAVLAAIFTDAKIFNRVLFAWGAMGAAFGPLLLVTVLRGPVAPVRSLLAMLFGAGLSVSAYYMVDDAADKGWERVLPFAVALLCAVWPGGHDELRSRDAPDRQGAPQDEVQLRTGGSARRR
jgi:sodium/proline symporter